MKPFTKHRGLVAAINRINVDTDQIVPKQFLKRIERTGYGKFLFYDWRFKEDGSPNPEFELNQPQFQGASILLAGANFGCGSSREHAVWALQDYGFRAILAPSFSDIFYNNSFKNGLLAVQIPEDQMRKLFLNASTIPAYQLTVDLHSQTVRDDAAIEIGFGIEPFERECLLNGWDEIGLTLRYEDRIAEYERRTFYE
jgi:3-isopropylmalate/(R)-2-methylmalate dehydratase small subunit